MKERGASLVAGLASGSDHESAHPMLEPLDYEFDPARAQKELEGPRAEVYSLLWNAGVATITEGPVVREHELLATIELPDGRHAIALVARARTVVEPGWSALLPREPLDGDHDHRQGMNAVLASLAPPPDLRMLTATEVVDTSELQLTPTRQWAPTVAAMLSAPMTEARLVELMAQFRVGRPSTYASRLGSALDNGLVRRTETAFGREVQTAARGAELLLRIGQLEAAAQVDAHFSGEVEQALGEIEHDPHLAGVTLDRFVQTVFGRACSLAKWLDRLEIEGESLAA